MVLRPEAAYKPLLKDNAAFCSKDKILVASEADLPPLAHKSPTAV